MNLTDVLSPFSKIDSPQVGGLAGSSISAFLAYLFKNHNKAVLVITPSTYIAEKIQKEISVFLDQKDIGQILPTYDSILGEEIPISKDILGKRLGILSSINENSRIFSPINAALIKTEEKFEFLEIEKGERYDLDSLVEKFCEFNYKRLPIVGEKGEFSLRGFLLDIYLSSENLPVRIEFEDEKVISIRRFSPQNQRSLEQIERIKIFPCEERNQVSILEHFDGLVVLVEPLELKKSSESFQKEVDSFGNKKGYLAFDGFIDSIKDKKEVSEFIFSPNQESIAYPAQFSGNVPVFLSELKKKKEEDYKVFIVTDHISFSESHSNLPAILGKLAAGFLWEKEKIVVYSDREIFGEKIEFKREKKEINEGVDENIVVDFNVGDYVVHEKYGIAKFQGMAHQEIDNIPYEYMELEFSKSDRLYVPLTQMGLVSKYSSLGEHVPVLSRLGGLEWKRKKESVKRSIRDLTFELLELYASRKQVSGFSFPRDDLWQKELEASFPYEETEDQLKAIVETKNDMENSHPMDRLICGDVGYGKTEVVIRAAAKSVSAGKQAAILVPTTILAEQHYNNFKKRFKSFPVNTEMLSRFRDKKEQEEIVNKLATGEIDIIIGTHRLIQRDVKFKNLGLLVIDEEHKFGVLHKERMKKFKRDVDVLSLSATPIPRTLYFSLAGIRDMSLITTPPLDRSPVKTYVLQWSEKVIREVILREIDRGGQVYFVFNYVEKMEDMFAKLKNIVPEVKMNFAHGRLSERELEKRMDEFLKREYDLLLCTSIIESGLDIPSVNTIIIDNADRFGLAQLYQLRGRVGRSSVRAYAYLFFHPEEVTTSQALERLKAIQEFTALGSGYKLAMRDLEIRGAGNLLGREQHGHIVEVGFETYCALMEETVLELKGQKKIFPKRVNFEIRVSGYIPSGYLPDERQRIAIYRRMNLIENKKELEELRNELKDRFGKLPEPLNKLFSILEIKVLALKRGIIEIRQSDSKLFVTFENRKKEGHLFQYDSEAERIRALSKIVNSYKGL